MEGGLVFHVAVSPKDRISAPGMGLWQSLPHSSCLSAVFLSVDISTFSYFPPYPPSTIAHGCCPHLLVGLQAKTSGSWGLASFLLLHLQIISPLPVLLAQRRYVSHIQQKM